MTYTFVDTHAHLYDEKFDDDRSEMIERAVAAGIQRMYLPNVDENTVEKMFALQKAYPDHCFAMAGLHPCDVRQNYKEQIEQIFEKSRGKRIVAVGEIGMDSYWDDTMLKEQEDAFRIQTQMAIDLDLPIAIHSRETTQKLIDVLQDYPQSRGVFHCFGGSLEQAKRIMEMGFYLGIGGVVTFKNAKLIDVIAEIGLDRVVLETDAPYLSPMPYRGKRNESSYIKNIAEFLADRLGLTLEEVSIRTTSNVENLFSNEIIFA